MLRRLTECVHAGAHAVGSEGAPAESSVLQQPQGHLQGPSTGKYGDSLWAYRNMDRVSRMTDRKLCQAERGLKEKEGEQGLHTQIRRSVALQDNHCRLQQVLLGEGRLQRVVFRCAMLYAKLHRAPHNRWQVGAQRLC